MIAAFTFTTDRMKTCYCWVMTNEQVVIYCRASTEKQTNSMNVQRSMCQSFAETSELTVIATFCEVASGSSLERNEFNKAIALVKKTGAILLTAKVDRLSRRISVIGGLIDDKIRIRCVQLGNQDVSKLILSVFAALAETERDFIRMRTKEALAHLKKQGVKLGSPNPRKGCAAGRKANAILADAFAAKLEPVILRIIDSGATTQGSIAEALNRLGYTTRRGSAFSATTVARMRARIAA